MFPIGHLYRGARRNPDGIAVEDGTRTLTHRDLVMRVDALASALQAMFPAPQTRIGVSGYNTIEHLLALLAVYASGHVWVPLNPRNGKPELDAAIAATRLAAVIADENCLERFSPPDCPVILGKTDGGRRDARTLDGLVERHRGERPSWPALTLGDVQGIKFTGGSTGRPKGVMQSYRVVNTSVVTMLDTYGFNGADVNICASPLTHAAAHFILPILGEGGRQILLDRPKAADILDALEQRGATTVFLPPTMIYNLMAEPSATKRRYPALKHLIYGAAPMPPERIREARAVFNDTVETLYGQTEAPMLITAMTAPDFADERNLASVGPATVLSEVAIMAPDGTVLPPGEVGEIVTRGDLVMNGYLDMPEETAKTIVYGWLHTGDVGALDERGYLYIKDRLRDVIISGGFNVYPSDVEAALAQHRAVYECIVYGAPDDKWGERVEAAVLLHPGAAATAEELIAFVKERVGSVKAPKIVHIVPDLPRSAVGKVLRREVKRLFAPPPRA
ncbi:MAG: class I adenylate-forming enzyme family protein [Candidatus Eiseniibacteriota bacterium]